MKLNKLSSLAIAGIVSVSMLTGCAGIEDGIQSTQDEPKQEQSKELSEEEVVKAITARMSNALMNGGFIENQDAVLGSIISDKVNIQIKCNIDIPYMTYEQRKPFMIQQNAYYQYVEAYVGIVNELASHNIERDVIFAVFDKDMDGIYEARTDIDELNPYLNGDVEALESMKEGTNEQTNDEGTQTPSKGSSERETIKSSEGNSENKSETPKKNTTTNKPSKKPVVKEEVNNNGTNSNKDNADTNGDGKLDEFDDYDDQPINNGTNSNKGHDSEVDYDVEINEGKDYNDEEAPLLD